MPRLWCPRYRSCLGLFRFSRKRFKGVLPYILLAAAWIAWERWYFTSAEISWPWLAFGNAFATNIKDIQWYSVTGTLGGSLWVWCANLGVFGLIITLAKGRWNDLTAWARGAIVAGLVLVLAGPPLCSAIMYNSRLTKRSHLTDV